MKKLNLKIILSLIGLLIFLTIYVNSSYFIENQDWKYSEGYNIGDGLQKDDIQLQNRVIYGNSGKAKVVFCFGIQLILENIETGEKGYYVNKS